MTLAWTLRPWRWIGVLGWLITLGCSSSSTTAQGRAPYLDDRAYRRSQLEAALVNPDDGYAQVRLAHYATGTAADWDQLPEWNPPTESIAASELAAPGGASSSSFAGLPLALELPDPDDRAALLAFGKLAFSRYPAQLAPYLSRALVSGAAAAEYGLWTDEGRGVGGLLRARMADGSVALALSCASCHAAPSTRGVADGAPNAALDLGAAIVASAGTALDSETRTHFAAWGAGRLDVTTMTGLEPARIADLRAVRLQTNLQQDATLLMLNETSLAIRIETLLITAHGQVVRPPRVLVLALAAYLASLGDELPDPAAAQAASPRGASIFSADCASCHSPPAFSGPAVNVALIGTDPTLGLSSERGTGTYRVPSLRGVGTRGPLLHDGSLPSLAAMFDPARENGDFALRLHGTGAVVGHRFGLELPDSDRAALLTYLSAL